MKTVAPDWLPATTLAIGRVTDDVIRTLLLAILHDDVNRALHRARQGLAAPGTANSPITPP